MPAKRKVPEVIRLHHVALSQSTLWCAVKTPNAGHLVDTCCEDERYVRGVDVLNGPDDVAVRLLLPCEQLLDLTLVNGRLSFVSLSTHITESITISVSSIKSMLLKCQTSVWFLKILSWVLSIPTVMLTTKASATVI